MNRKDPIQQQIDEQAVMLPPTHPAQPWLAFASHMNAEGAHYADKGQTALACVAQDTVNAAMRAVLHILENPQ